MVIFLAADHPLHYIRYMKGLLYYAQQLQKSNQPNPKVSSQFLQKAPLDNGAVNRAFPLDLSSVAISLFSSSPRKEGLGKRSGGDKEGEVGERGQISPGVGKKVSHNQLIFFGGGEEERVRREKKEARRNSFGADTHKNKMYVVYV